MLNNDLDKIFSTVFGIDNDLIQDNLSPDNLEAWDSMAQFRLIAEIERVFNLSLDYEEIFAMNSVGDIKRILIEKTGSRISK